MVVAPLIAVVGSAARASADPSTLPAGQSLTAGQSLISPNGQLTLVMQTDGNLVEYMGAHALWSSRTAGNVGDRVTMQSDGNLVIYAANNQPLEASNTGGHPNGAYFLTLQSDANLVIYGPTGAIYANSALATTLQAGQSLQAGQFLTSPNRQFTLEMGFDGNLTESMGTQFLWSAGTAGAGNYLIMQGDGNLVIYSPGGMPLWNSHTGGHQFAAFFLSLQSDANAVVYGPGGFLYANFVVASTLLSGQSLLGGQFLTSPNSRFTLIMQPGGDLVEYQGRQALWATGTGGNPGDRVVIQTDGNLVIYGANGHALWDSLSQGNPPAAYFLVLQSDANLVIYGPNGPIWANHVNVRGLGGGPPPLP